MPPRAAKAIKDSLGFAKELSNQLRTISHVLHRRYRMPAGLLKALPRPTGWSEEKLWQQISLLQMGSLSKQGSRSRKRQSGQE